MNKLLSSLDGYITSKPDIYKVYSSEMDVVFYTIARKTLYILDLNSNLFIFKKQFFNTVFDDFVNKYEHCIRSYPFLNEKYWLQCELKDVNHFNDLKSLIDINYLVHQSRV